MSKRKLLIITTEYFHPTRFRLHYMLPYLRKVFDIKLIAIAPLTYDLDFNGDGRITSRKNILSALRKLPHTLTRMIDERNKELVIVRTPFPGIILSWLYALLTALYVALLMKLRRMHRGFDACLATINFAGFCTLLAKMPLPIIYEDVDRCEYFYRGNLARRISRFVEAYCIRNSTEVVSAGYALAESAQTLRGRTVHCVPNGIDVGMFEGLLAETSMFARDRNFLVYVGFIDRWSGLDKAINALALTCSEFPNTRLNIAGRGTSVVELKRLAKDLRVEDKVNFLGHLEYGRIPRLLLNSGIGLATYQDSELMRYAFTYKLLEYMAAGLAVIATDVGDTGRIVRESRCGLVAEQNPAAISKAMTRLLRDRDLMETFSRNGRNFVKRFDLRCLAKQEIEIILKSIKHWDETSVGAFGKENLEQS